MEGRGYEGDTNLRYRFGFNGKENDNDVRGDGNSLDFGARVYDPRLVRWLSLDPSAQKYPGASPYNFANNSPLYFIDPNGKSGQPNHVQRAIDAQNEYEKKGNMTVLRVTNQGKVKLDVYHTEVHPEWVQRADGKYEIQDVTRIIYDKTITYNRTDKDRFLDVLHGIADWTGLMTENGEFYRGIVITSKLGGKKNPLASKLAENGKYIEIDESVLDALGSLQKDAQTKKFKRMIGKKGVGTEMTRKKESPESKDMDIEGRGKDIGGRLKDTQDKLVEKVKVIIKEPDGEGGYGSKDTFINNKDLNKYKDRIISK